MEEKENKQDLEYIPENPQKEDKNPKIDYSHYSYEELAAMSRDAHQEDVRQYDKEQNALCFVVIGGILLVIAILFIFLSMKRQFNKLVGIDFSSLQFIILCITSAASLGCLGYGLTRFIIAANKRKELHAAIKEIAIAKSKLMK